MSVIYNIGKKAAMLFPPIKRHVAYTRDLEERLEELTLRDREKRNLIGTLYGLQEYHSDLFVDGVYRHVVTITSKVGCPINCRYCPQDQFVAAYMKRPNPVLSLSYEYFCSILDKIPSDTQVRFTGFVENMANPECIPMIKKALETHKVMVYSTMFNADISDYEAFRDHCNLTTFCLHLPDCFGNTRFPITDKYRDLLKYIVQNPPAHALFWTSCLGEGGGVSPDIADIIQTHANPISSFTGLVYDNFLHHGNAELICLRDSSRIQDERAGVIPVLPNGDVVACTQDSELTSIIGNIFQVSSLEELLHSEGRSKFYKGLKDASLNTICRTCEMAVKNTYGTPLDTRV